MFIKQPRYINFPTGGHLSDKDPDYHGPGGTVWVSLDPPNGCFVSRGGHYPAVFMTPISAEMPFLDIS